MARNYIYMYIIISVSGVIVKVLKEETVYLDQLMNSACLKTGDVSATEKPRNCLVEFLCTHLCIILYVYMCFIIPCA